MSKSSIQTHFIEKHRVRIADREAQDFVDMFHGKEQQQLTMGGGRYRLFRTKDGQMFRVFAQQKKQKGRKKKRSNRISIRAVSGGAWGMGKR